MSLHRTIDRIGTTMSLACSVHCAAAPILITVAPLIGLGFVFDSNFETILILVTCGLASLSVAWGFYKKHRRFLPLGILLLGIALISLKYAEIEAFPEPLLMFLGGTSIAASHIINSKLCRVCDTCEHDH